MISHRFAYHAPDTLAAALEVLDGEAETAVLAGGTWLVPNMTHGLRQPPAVLDIKRLGLRAVREEGGDLVIGAAATYQDVLRSAAVAAHAPLLGAMAGEITGGAQITGQATLGGSACYANPASDVPACLCALGARLRLASQNGCREVDAAGFFLGAFRTACRRNEMLTAIVIPGAVPGVVPGTAPWRSSAYRKLKTSYGSWPIVTASCLSREAGPRTVRHRIAVGAANVVPVVFEADTDANAPEEALAALGARAASLIADECADELAGPGYRRRVTPAMVAKAVRGSLDAW